MKKLKVDYHSIGEIHEKLLDSLKIPIEVIYSSQPKSKIPYNLGKISQKTLDMTKFFSDFYIIKILFVFSKLFLFLCLECIIFILY